MILFYKPEDCCGCSACRNICPRGAIRMTADEKGFLYPCVDPQLCVECGLCRTVCPMHGTFPVEENPPEQDAFAVKHRSDQVRMQSSSGGMFTALSDYILEQDGAVYGAAFDRDFQVCHCRAKTQEERDRFRGSKYVQSNLGSVFLQVKDDLEGGRAVLFSGTPCQTAGLSGFLAGGRTNTNRLYLCDLVCHGTPSPKLWKDYLALLTKRYRNRIKSYSFRDKSIGWRGYQIEAVIQDGTVVRDRLDVLSYSKLFCMDLNLRPSCYRCPFASLHRPSDITVGDFWGIENSMPEFEDEKGVSLVLVNTEKGRRLFQQVKESLLVRPSNLERCIQPNLKRPSTAPAEKDKFWEDYRNRGFIYVSKKYGDGGLKGKLKKGIKKVLKRCGLFDALKQVLRR